jgi:hypothetical protein
VNYGRIAIAAIKYLAIGLVGAVLTAQATGWWGHTQPDRYRILYAPVGEKSVEVNESRGFGRRELTWRTLDPWAAAIWQDIKEERTETRHGQEPRYAPEGAVPSWCSVWNDQLREISDTAHTNAAAQRASIDPPFDIGIGWPLTCFSVSQECQIDATTTLPPPAPVHGGLIKTKNGLPPWRVLSWRPYIPGLLADTIIFALGAALLTRLAIGARSYRRRRANLCPRCAYDRRGLPPTAPCPECGTS